MSSKRVTGFVLALALVGFGFSAQAETGYVIEPHVGFEYGLSGTAKSHMGVPVGVRIGGTFGSMFAAGIGVGHTFDFGNEIAATGEVVKYRDGESYLQAVAGKKVKHSLTDFGAYFLAMPVDMMRVYLSAGYAMTLFGHNAADVFTMGTGGTAVAEKVGFKGMFARLGAGYSFKGMGVPVTANLEVGARFLSAAKKAAKEEKKAGETQPVSLNTGNTADTAKTDKPGTMGLALALSVSVPLP